MLGGSALLVAGQGTVQKIGNTLFFLSLENKYEMSEDISDQTRKHLWD